MDNEKDLLKEFISWAEREGAINNCTAEVLRDFTVYYLKHIN